MLHAWRGVGKTHVALGIAYAVASGGTFLKWKAPRPRRALYLDGEMPAVAMQERIAAAAQSSDTEPPSPDYLRIITPDLQPVGTPMPNLMTEEGRAAVEEQLEGVDLLVIDNISTLARSGKENEADAWEPMQTWLLGLRRRGISVVLVHHGAKSGNQRGTSKREDVLDTVVNLRRPNDYQPTEGARFEVHLEKCRGLFGEEAKAFEVLLETRDGTSFWTMRDIEDAKKARAEALLAEGGLSIRDVAEEVGLSKSAVGRISKKMKGDDE
jgi:putative DNA primase/helicase